MRSGGKNRRSKPRSGERMSPRRKPWVERWKTSKELKGRKKGIKPKPGTNIRNLQSAADAHSTRPARGTCSLEPRAALPGSHHPARSVARSQASRESLPPDRSDPYPPAAATAVEFARHKTGPGPYWPPQSDVIYRRTADNHSRPPNRLL